MQGNLLKNVLLEFIYKFIYFAMLIKIVVLYQFKLIFKINVNYLYEVTRFCSLIESRI